MNTAISGTPRHYIHICRSESGSTMVRGRAESGKLSACRSACRSNVRLRLSRGSRRQGSPHPVGHRGGEVLAARAAARDERPGRLGGAGRQRQHAPHNVAHRVEHGRDGQLAAQAHVLQEAALLGRLVRRPACSRASPGYQEYSFFFPCPKIHSRRLELPLMPLS